ncbi:predicted protein [Plenodomus lingam JN3]|uniref:Predicted protein n=1 Tax=Leptosphaeria maculans (strain JN3 / isolate v23.1.3 / race Av1-4-5-6-7-8) TaxID=985895 RepID=E5AFE3_LEPMJ|nr:predicted protein [Plenodomus lingam JN3]CBY01932.1 predicted protein [Plenodomus lingam JN3]
MAIGLLGCVKMAETITSFAVLRTMPVNTRLPERLLTDTVHSNHDGCQLTTTNGANPAAS